MPRSHLRPVKREPSNIIPSMPPAKPVEKDTGRRILVYQLEQVAGPPPIRLGVTFTAAAIAAVTGIAFLARNCG